jgi:hypothetical protein
MKKIISFVLTILIVFSCTYSFSSSIDEFQVGDEDIYEGVPGYRNIRNNILYKDVKKTWGRSSIYKLSALGFIHGNSKGYFRPKSYITRKEALECIGKSMGIYTDDYVKALIKEKIISKEEKNQKCAWGRNATREEIAVWIGRSLGLKETKNFYMVNGFKDRSKFKSSYLPMVETVLENGIMCGYSNGYFKPKHFITREEFAKTLDMAIDDILINRGYKIKTGDVQDIKVLVVTEVNTPVVKNILYMRNEDGTYPIIYTSKASKLNLNKGFIIYRGGRLKTSDDIDIWDYMKYYVDEKNRIVYGEM